MLVCPLPPYSEKAMKLRSIVRDLRKVLDYTDSLDARDSIARQDAQIAVLGVIRQILEGEYAAEKSADAPAMELRAEHLSAELQAIDKRIVEAYLKRALWLKGSRAR